MSFHNVAVQNNTKKIFILQSFLGDPPLYAEISAKEGGGAAPLRNNLNSTSALASFVTHV